MASKQKRSRRNLTINRAKPSKHNGGSGFIRIISGRWRGRKIPVPDSTGLRPTTDRTKETLFNWLMPYLGSGYRCLDLFAGSGSLGFEALSRYAQLVVMVEKEPAIVKKLKTAAATLASDQEQAAPRLDIVEADALSYLSGCRQTFDLVFLDPPFNQGLLVPALQKLVASGCLAKDAVIYAEHEIELEWGLPHGIQELKQKQTKQVASRLLQYTGV